MALPPDPKLQVDPKAPNLQRVTWTDTKDLSGEQAEHIKRLCRPPDRDFAVVYGGVMAAFLTSEAHSGWMNEVPAGEPLKLLAMKKSGIITSKAICFSRRCAGHFFA